MYWKLLNLYTNEYTTHESEEEVNHIIDFFCRDMQESRKTIRQSIKTPFSNYDFNHVLIYDDFTIRHFVYFFDTIEEELDSREDDEMKKQRDNAIELLNKKTAALFIANRTIDNLESIVKDLKTKLSILEADIDDTYERKMEYEKEIEEWCKRCIELKQDHRRLEALLAKEQRYKNQYIDTNSDMLTAIHHYCNKCGTFTCDDCPLRHF